MDMKTVSGVTHECCNIRSHMATFSYRRHGISLCEIEVGLLALDLQKAIQREDQMESYTGPVQAPIRIRTAQMLVPSLPLLDDDR